MNNVIHVKDNCTPFCCYNFSKNVDQLANKLSTLETTSAKIHLCVFFNSEKTLFDKIIKPDPLKNNLAEKISAELRQIITECASTETEHSMKFDLNLFVKIKASAMQRILSLGRQSEQIICFQRNVHEGTSSGFHNSQIGPYDEKCFLTEYAETQQIWEKEVLKVLDDQREFVLS